MNREKNDKSTINYNLWQKIKPWLFVIPVIIVVLVTMVWPFIQTIIRSFFLTDNLGQLSVFIGLENYTELFTSLSFWNSVKVTVKYCLIVVVVGVLLGLVEALLCQKAFPGVSFFNTSYAMPMAIASVGLALIFKVMVNPTMGIVNRIFNINQNLLVNADAALVIVALVTGWLNSGLNFLYFKSGLANIDDSLYESASIDGANGVAKFFNITLPSLRPIFFFVIVTNIINAFQGFGQIDVLTKGGPGEATNVIIYDIYKNAFQNGRYGYASAESVVLFFVILILTLIIFKIRRED